MDTQTVGPALTPEEWAGIPEAVRGGLTMRRHDEVAPELYATWIANGGQQVCARTSQMHALAALALHQQPFGFTRQDVDFLRNTAEDEPRNVATDMRNLADRIAALLPPK